MRKDLVNTQKVFLIAIVFSVLMTLVTVPAVGDNGGDYEKFLKKPSMYGSIVNALRDEESKMRFSRLTTKEAAAAVSIDLLLSLSCLWASIFLVTGKAEVELKKYLWFLLIFNLGWFVILMLFKTQWFLFDYLVVRLRSDLQGAFKDNFSILVIIAAILVYVWFLARTFQYGFARSVGIFLVSHTIYIVAIFLISAACPKHSALCKTMKKSFGVRPMIRQYLADVEEISSRNPNVLSLLRPRVFHL